MKSVILRRRAPVLLKLFIAIVILITIVLILAATKPDRIRFTRSILITAPPEKIFALINDFHNWPRWAPQDREDPAMVRTYGSSAVGVGAVSDWRGNRNTGQGTMKITESAPPRTVTVEVDFVKPFTVHNINRFVLESSGGQTNVAWTMDGSNLFVMKLMSVFVSLDQMMGKHFETGLANVKAAAEN